jgi:hypothetical protein
MKLAAGLLGLGAYLCSALLYIPATAQEAPAQDEKAEVAALEAQYAAFVQQTSEFREATFAIHQALLEKTPPSLQDPAYAGQVAKAFDTAQLETIKDHRFLTGICNRAGAVQGDYLLRGVKNDELDPFAIQRRLKFDASAATLKLRSENYSRFQDELVQALRYGLMCRTFELEKLNTYLPQMPAAELNVFRTGFADFQESLAELVTYHAAALRQPIRPENRKTIIDLLAQYMDRLAAGMSKQTRRTAAASIAKALTAPALTPADRKKLATAQQALKRTDCGKVCAFR